MHNLALANTSVRPESSNETFFNQLVADYSTDLHRYAYWLCSDRQIAEDLVQETLFRAWKSLDKLTNRNAIKGWLLTIVRRENARRFERKQLPVSDIPLEGLAGTRNSYDTSTEAFVLRCAIDKLPEAYRTPLVQQVIGGYSQKEIADRLGITSAGVGTRLFRARNKLKDALAA